MIADLDAPTEKPVIAANKREINIATILVILRLTHKDTNKLYTLKTIIDTCRPLIASKCEIPEFLYSANTYELISDRSPMVTPFEISEA